MKEIKQSSKKVETLDDLAKLVDYSLMDTLNSDPNSSDDGIDSNTEHDSTDGSDNKSDHTIDDTGGGTPRVSTGKHSGAGGTKKNLGRSNSGVLEVRIFYISWIF